MWDASEGILDIEPGDGEGSRLSACIIYNRFEEEGMFIASFAGKTLAQLFSYRNKVNHSNL